MRFIQCNTSNYSKGRVDKIKYIVIHYTANHGTTAYNECVNLKNNTNRKASAHFFVDPNEIIQSVKVEDTAWHCGTSGTYRHKYCRNKNSIGIEMCVKNKNGKGKPSTDNGWYFEDQTVINTLNLTKELMEKYNIPLENVIRHYDVTGKICPAPYVNNNNAWSKFKEELEELMMPRVIYNNFNDIPDWGKEAVNYLISKNILSGDRNGLNLSEDMLRMIVLMYKDEMIKKEVVYNNINEIPYWGKEAVNYLISKNILSGDGNGLNLSEDMLRMIVLMYKDEMIKKDEVYNTIDEVPYWGKEAVKYLIDTKVLSGDGNKLNLTDDVLRTIEIMYRADMFKKVYNTIDEIPNWAYATINKLIENGILQGNGNGLELTDSFIRTLVILDRAGKLD